MMMLKHLIKFPIYTSILLISLSSCEENDSKKGEEQSDVITIEDVAQGELKAVVDGEKVTAQAVQAVLTDQMFTIVVQLPEDRVLTITLDNLDENTYNLGSGENGAVLIEGENNAYVLVDGQLSIVELNSEVNTISGSFEAKLQWGEKQINIGSAAFNTINYSVEQASPQNGSMSADVNGVSWTAEEITIKNIAGVLDIKGMNESMADISMYMPEDIAPGTYTLSGNGAYVAIVYPAGETIGTHYADSGELTITKHDTENRIIEGSFHFNATRTGDDQAYDVTNGSFNYTGY